MSNLKTHASSFRAEAVKLRKSWPMLAAILTPVCLVGFLGAIVWYSGGDGGVVMRFRPGSRFWLDLNVAGWNLFVMPALAAMMAELSWAQDRDAFAWRHLLCQPSPRVAQYLAKLTNLWGLLMLSQILLFCLIPLTRLLLLKNEELWMMGQMEIALFWEFACFSLVASIPIMAFHTWFSFRLPGAGPALGVALVGTWGAMKLVGVTHLVQFLPWGLSGHAPTIFDRYKKVPWGYFPWKYCIGAVILALALAALGSLDFKRHAFTKSLERD